MAIVTLTTDFGLADAYTGIVKGVMLTVEPAMTIVDLSHGIAPGDVRQAAYLVASAYRYFPAGSLHVVVVDPGVGSRRRIVAVEVGRHRFLVPDNGVLTGVLAEAGAERGVAVENTRYFLSPLSRTFHGRDIFAPVAAHLSGGLDLGKLGPVIDCRSLVRLDWAPSRSHGGGITGSVMAVDRFGNLITNIQEGQLAELCGGDFGGCEVRIRMAGRTINGLSTAYTSVPPGEPLAIIGSAGRLEISLNGGHAGEAFGIGPGEEIRVDVPPVS